MKGIGMQDDSVYQLNKKDLDSLVKSKHILVTALDLEIIFDQLIESHCDYKNRVNYWNIRILSRSLIDHVGNHEIRGALNRLAFNTLNLSKLYLDSHYHEKKNRCFAFEISEDASSTNKIEKQRTEIFESNLGYVVGCKLRAHSQHSQLPVRSFTTGIRIDHHTQERVSSFKINYGYDDLCKLEVPKKRIRKDICLDLTTILDEYIYAISSMHKLNRKLVGSRVNKAKSDIEELCKRIITSPKWKSKLHEIQIGKNEYISPELSWFSVYEYLQTKHRCPINFTKVSLSD